MRLWANKDFWAGVLFILIGIAAVMTGRENDMGTLSRMGPAYFPTVVGSLLTGLGAVMAVRACVWPDHQEGDQTPQTQWGVLLFILGSVALFACCLLWLGLLAAVVLLVLTASLAGGTHKPLEALMLSVVLAVAAWAIFVAGLGLHIDLWPAFL
ncbi:membrane protein containing DUF1468 [gut metagenome]|uniref:Membrane protein containing DUF1468 n=1 Tax=gut metagenome TaxID=749906 RepID=J9D4B4_9ZZZZ